MQQRRRWRVVLSFPLAVTGGGGGAPSVSVEF